jgi:hypothetical protein
MNHERWKPVEQAKLADRIRDIDLRVGARQPAPLLERSPAERPMAATAPGDLRAALWMARRDDRQKA